MPGQVNQNYLFPKALYDLRLDPGERNDLLPYHPDMVEKLDGIADEARKDLGDALYNMPGENRRQPGRISR